MRRSIGTSHRPIVTRATPHGVFVSGLLPETEHTINYGRGEKVPGQKVKEIGASLCGQLRRDVELRIRNGGNAKEIGAGLDMIESITGDRDQISGL